MSTWWAYVRRTAGPGATQAEIATRAGVTQATVSRWASGDIERPEAAVAVKLALRYNGDVGRALVAAGVMDERHLPLTRARHEDMTDDELLAILAERLRRRATVTPPGRHP